MFLTHCHRLNVIDKEELLTVLLVLLQQVQHQQVNYSGLLPRYVIRGRPLLNTGLLKSITG